MGNYHCMFRLISVVVALVIPIGNSLAQDGEQAAAADSTRGNITAADIVGPDGIVYADFSRAGIPGGIPDVKVVVSVVDFGAVPNDDQDDSAAIQAAIAAAGAKGGGAVMLPDGDYIIDQTIRLDRDNVVLRGADRERTRLVPRFAGKDTSKTSSSLPIIRMGPEDARRRYDAHPDRPIKRGDISVHLPVNAVKQVRVGDIVTFTATPPKSVIATLSPQLQKQATDGSYGSIYSWQYLQVTAIDNGTVTFDRPIRLDVAMDQSPKLMHVPAMVTGCGIENLTIEQTSVNPGINGISMTSTRGCWLSGVSVRRVGNWPLSVSRSWQFIIRDCKLDESLSRGGAVAYVGFSFACDGLIEQSQFSRLRHLSISMASNGLVFRDCQLDNIDINFHLNWPYEVLFENCRVDSGLGANPAPREESRGSYGYGIYSPRIDGDMHAPAGPRLTFYHNDIASPWDGVMLGGGATQNTIVAYNRFRVSAGFAAVIRRGSDDSIFRGNSFVLHDPEKRKGWMMKESYGSDDPEAVRGAVFFPQGVPSGLAFEDNNFRVPHTLPLFAGGDPAVVRGNELLAAGDDSATSERVSLVGDWRLKAVDLRPAAATPAAKHADPGTSQKALGLLAADAPDGDWATVAMPAMINDKAADLTKMDGELVLRHHFDMPRELLGKEVVLSLGLVDDYDETWVNGKKVGDTSGDDAWKTPRRYTIPADLLRPTGNVIAVRVWDAFGSGGLSGSKRDLWVGIPPKAIKLDEGSVPTPPVPSLYGWQKERVADPQTQTPTPLNR